MRMMERKCWYRNCTSMTRNVTGLCADHAHHVDQHTTARPPTEATRMFGQAGKYRRKPKHGLGG